MEKLSGRPESKSWPASQHWGRSSAKSSDAAAVEKKQNSASACMVRRRRRLSKSSNYTYSFDGVGKLRSVVCDATRAVAQYEICIHVRYISKRSFPCLSLPGNHRRPMPWSSRRPRHTVIVIISLSCVRQVCWRATCLR